ncbi:universal stress protein [Pontivivens insulae]|uniref:Universal stress protein n=1 Tax=Pontivivens insulae TaxID=1639689 RepID=A0A2R8AFA5_9RHOB|nr:universal stress protein [Pontivivens insulae]RED12121.1 nucleotide-binding universal stress UspA family protein [Pontivivens insulae]SPF30877.1 Putative universal stress protein [Pontivivens insulae]
MFKTVLLSYDGSDHAQNALATAVSICKAYGAKLHVAHVPQLDTPPVVVGAFVGAIEIPPTAQQVAEAGEHLIADVTSKAAVQGVEIAKCHVGMGVPADHVLNVAQSVGADLIVTGRRGLGALGSLALGSVSLAIAQRAKCACMTVI